jgi:hypothetical protein
MSGSWLVIAARHVCSCSYFTPLPWNAGHDGLPTQVLRIKYIMIIKIHQIQIIIFKTRWNNCFATGERAPDEKAVAFESLCRFRIKTVAKNSSTTRKRPKYI